MTNSPLKSVIVGCGAIAHEHVRFIAASPRAEFVAAVDRSAALATFFKEHYGAQTAATDLTSLLATNQIDVVHILTPPGTHEDLVVTALDAGCHVICEKPMSGTLAQTEALLTHAQSRGRVLIESANTLWNENVVALKKLVDDGVIGDVREIEIALALDLASGPFGDLNLGGGVALPGGAVHDFLPHMCGAFLHLAGVDRVEAVVGRLGNASGNRRVKYDFLDCLVVDPRVRGRLSLSPDISPSAFKVTVRGTRASAETELFNPYLRITGADKVGKLAPLELIQSGKRMMSSGVRGFRNKIVQHTPYHSMDVMLDDIYAALQSGAPIPITPDKIAATARFVDQVVAIGQSPTRDVRMPTN